MTTRAWITGAAFPIVLGACSYGADAGDASDDSAVTNSCVTDADCGGGSCVDGSCEGESSALEALLLEITLPATAGGGYSSARYLLEIDGLKRGEDLSVDLGRMAQVTGRIIPDEDITRLGQTVCELRFRSPADPSKVIGPGDDGSVPSTVTFIPRERLLGLSPVSYAASSSLTDDGGSHQFSVRLPPGGYDVYVAPFAADSDACPLPPQLLRTQEIEPGNVDVELPLPLPRPLALDVAVPGAASTEVLAGWTVDVVDAESQSVLSTQGILGVASTTEGSVTYSTAIAYSPAWSLPDSTFDDGASEYVRLRPPATVIGPTVFVARPTLDLFGEGHAQINFVADGGRLHEPVTLEARLESSWGPAYNGAAVRFVATSLLGIAPGIQGAFSAQAIADGEGAFSVQLLPGIYDVFAIPSPVTCCAEGESACSCPATTAATWEVADAPAYQAGRTLALSDGGALTGRVVKPNRGDIASGSTIEAVPVAPPTTLLQRLRRESIPLPRAANAPLEADGHFAVSLDWGAYDVTVRTPASSGYAWLVRPGLSIDKSDATDRVVDVGTWKLPLPIPYRGSVRVPVGNADANDSLVEVPGSLVRAYAYLDAERRRVDSRQEASAVQQVAEVRADAEGSFVLLIPESLGE